jgi:hypothetical protein
LGQDAENQPKTGRTFETCLRAQFNAKPLNVAGNFLFWYQLKYLSTWIFIKTRCN